MSSPPIPPAQQMIPQAKILSVLVGLPKTRLMPENNIIDMRTATWTSGIYKDPVAGKVWAGKNGLAGDGQEDPKNHGGPDNVLLAYDARHYPDLRTRLNHPHLQPGSFGENLSLEPLPLTSPEFTDETVCIGDIWKVRGAGLAEVILQVSQPRQPCWKLARRVGTPEVVKIAMETGWGGWYLRVLQEGYIAAGMTIELTERLHPEWPVREAVWLMYERKKDRARAQVLAQIPELSERWKRELIN